MPSRPPSDLTRLHERMAAVEAEQADQSSEIAAQRLQLAQLFRVYEQVRGVRIFVVTLAGVVGSLLTVLFTVLSFWWGMQ